MNDQLNQSGQLSNSQDGCQTNSEGMTVLRLGQYGRPSLATAGLLVMYVACCSGSVFLWRRCDMLSLCTSGWVVYFWDTV